MNVAGKNYATMKGERITFVGPYSFEIGFSSAPARSLMSPNLLCSLICTQSSAVKKKPQAIKSCLLCFHSKVDSCWDRLLLMAASMVSELFLELNVNVKNICIITFIHFPLPNMTKYLGDLTPDKYPPLFVF